MSTDLLIKVLSKCPLFAGLSFDEIALVLSDLDYRQVRFANHDVYALAGMPCKWADIILSGILICRMSSVSGKQVEVSRLRPGNLVAPAFIFAKDKAMPVSVETSGEVVVLRLKPEALQRLLGIHEVIRMNFIRVLSNIDVFLTQKMRVLSLLTIREKVAYMLLEQAGEQGTDTVLLHQSRQAIADSFGIQKFSLLRVLSDLEKEGIIEIKGKEIKIMDRKRLSL